MYFGVWAQEKVFGKITFFHVSAVKVTFIVCKNPGLEIEGKVGQVLDGAEPAGTGTWQGSPA